MMLNRIAVLAIAGAALAPAAACTRTSDGSVVMSRPLHMPAMPGFMRRDRHADAGASVAAVSFPQAPQPHVERPRRVAAAPKLRAWQVRTVRTPFASGRTAQPLKCHNAPSDGGRVKVVCE